MTAKAKKAGIPLLTARWWHPAARKNGKAFAKRAGLAVLGGIGLFALWLVPAVVLGDPEYRKALLVTQTATTAADYLSATLSASSAAIVTVGVMGAWYIP